MTTQTLRRGGLDWNVPNDGKAADAYAVACTAVMLDMHRPKGQGNPLSPARHATRLHVISGLLHRLSERQCNEDLCCRECQGSGFVTVADGGPRQNGASTARQCTVCAGAGLTIGRRLKSLEADAQEIAQHYGLTCYFQGDPRGCSLYLLEPGTNPNAYTRGHAVVRLGR